MKCKSFWASSILLGLGLGSMASSCSHRIYVPVESVRIDTIANTSHRVDTILDRDSIYLGLRGDTVVKEVYRWRWRTRQRIDTLYRSRTDTVRVPVEITPERERTSSKFPSLSKIWDMARILLFLIIVYIAWRSRKN